MSLVHLRQRFLARTRGAALGEAPWLPDIRTLADAPEQCFPVSTQTIGGKTYRSLPEKYRSWFKVTFAGWDIADPPSGPMHQGIVRVRLPPEADEVMAVPLLKPPPDVGNLFRWTEQHLEAGDGIVVIPPEGWTECDDLLRWPTGQMRAFAGKSASILKYAEPGSRGFVLYDPPDGWSTFFVTPTKSQMGKLAVAGGLIAIAAIALKVSAPWEKRARAR